MSSQQLAILQNLFTSTPICVPEQRFMNEFDTLIDLPHDPVIDQFIKNYDVESLNRLKATSQNLISLQDDKQLITCCSFSEKQFAIAYKSGIIDIYDRGKNQVDKQIALQNNQFANQILLMDDPQTLIVVNNQHHLTCYQNIRMITKSFRDRFTVQDYKSQLINMIQLPNCYNGSEEYLPQDNFENLLVSADVDGQILLNRFNQQGKNFTQKLATIKSKILQIGYFKLNNVELSDVNSWREKISSYTLVIYVLTENACQFFALSSDFSQQQLFKKIGTIEHKAPSKSAAIGIIIQQSQPIITSVFNDTIYCHKIIAKSSFQAQDCRIQELQKSVIEQLADKEVLQCIMVSKDALAVFLRDKYLIISSVVVGKIGIVEDVQYPNKLLLGSSAQIFAKRTNNSLEALTVEGKSVGVYALDIPSFKERVDLVLRNKPLCAIEMLISAGLKVGNFETSNPFILNIVERFQKIVLDDSLLTCFVPASLTSQVVDVISNAFQEGLLSRLVVIHQTIKEDAEALKLWTEVMKFYVNGYVYCLCMFEQTQILCNLQLQDGEASELIQQQIYQCLAKILEKFATPVSSIVFKQLLARFEDKVKLHSDYFAWLTLNAYHKDQFKDYCQIIDMFNFHQIVPAVNLQRILQFNSSDIQNSYNGKYISELTYSFITKKASNSDANVTELIKAYSAFWSIVFSGDNLFIKKNSACNVQFKNFQVSSYFKFQQKPDDLVKNVVSSCNEKLYFFQPYINQTSLINFYTNPNQGMNLKLFQVLSSDFFEFWFTYQGKLIPFILYFYCDPCGALSVFEHFTTSGKVLSTIKTRDKMDFRIQIFDKIYEILFKSSAKNAWINMAKRYAVQIIQLMVTTMLSIVNGNQIDQMLAMQKAFQKTVSNTFTSIIVFDPPVFMLNTIENQVRVKDNKMNSHVWAWIFFVLFKTEDDVEKLFTDKIFHIQNSHPAVEETSNVLNSQFGVKFLPTFNILNISIIEEVLGNNLRLSDYNYDNLEINALLAVLNFIHMSGLDTQFLGKLMEEYSNRIQNAQISFIVKLLSFDLQLKEVETAQLLINTTLINQKRKTQMLIEYIATLEQLSRKNYMLDKYFSQVKDQLNAQTKDPITTQQLIDSDQRRQIQIATQICQNHLVNIIQCNDLDLDFLVQVLVYVYKFQPLQGLLLIQQLSSQQPEVLQFKTIFLKFVLVCLTPGYEPKEAGKNGKSIFRKEKLEQMHEQLNQLTEEKLALQSRQQLNVILKLYVGQRLSNDPEPRHLLFWDDDALRKQSQDGSKSKIDKEKNILENCTKYGEVILNMLFDSCEKVLLFKILEIYHNNLLITEVVNNYIKSGKDQRIKFYLLYLHEDDVQLLSQLKEAFCTLTRNKKNEEVVMFIEENIRFYLPLIAKRMILKGKNLDKLDEARNEILSQSIKIQDDQKRYDVLDKLSDIYQEFMLAGDLVDCFLKLLDQQLWSEGHLIIDKLIQKIDTQNEIRHEILDVVSNDLQATCMRKANHLSQGVAIDGQICICGSNLFEQQPMNHAQSITLADQSVIKVAVEEQSNQVYLFQCGHCSHHRCLDETVESKKSLDNVVNQYLSTGGKVQEVYHPRREVACPFCK